MSWIEKIKTGIRITCGDGQVYSPLSVQASPTDSKSKEYNTAEFVFDELEGSLVKRGTPIGRRYVLEIVFQGEDHLDQAEAFEKSADDKRPWTVAHPLYGQVLVQPTSFSQDNTALNISRITCPVIETMPEDAPKANTSPEDQIAADKATSDELLANSYAEEVPVKVADRTEMTARVDKVYQNGIKDVKNNLDKETYLNAFNTANSYITNATSEPLAAMRSIQAMINTPAQFADSVRNRLNTLLNQLNSLRATVSGLTGRNSKKLYEGMGGTIISTMALATVTNVGGGDYTSRSEVVGVIDLLYDAHNGYMEDLDALQSANGGSPTSYIPHGPGITALGKLVSYALANLFAVANNSKQERTVYLDYDSNPIEVCYRYFGLDAADANLEAFIKINNIGPNEILKLRKGRAITYYV